MATRAIKKLTKGNDLKQLSALAAKQESDEENSQSDGDETTPPIVPKNKFDLVNQLEFPNDAYFQLLERMPVLGPFFFLPEHFPNRIFFETH